MRVWVVIDDGYDRNIICVTTDRKIADKAFDDHNAELVAKGFRPNSETDRMYLIEQYEVVQKKAETNAERIRKMTDEELAYILAGQCSCCAYQSQVSDCTNSPCKKGVLEWLKQEVENG